MDNIFGGREFRGVRSSLVPKEEISDFNAVLDSIEEGSDFSDDDQYICTASQAVQDLFYEFDTGITSATARELRVKVCK